MKERLFSDGGTVDDWTTSTGDTFAYDGSLSNGDSGPVAAFNDAGKFLDWFRHDILNEIFKDSNVEFQADNSVVVGALLRQTRAQQGTCTKSTFFDQQVCTTAGSFKVSSAPFGTDVTFDSAAGSTHGLYDAATSVADFYSDDEISPDTGLPYGFFSDAQTADKVEDTALVGFGSRPPAALSRFPVFFDRRMSRAQVNFLGVYLEAGGYVDDMTRVLEVTLITYSKRLDLFGEVQVSATLNQAANRWDTKSSIDMIDVVVYSDSPIDTWRKILEAFYLICLVTLIMREVFELKDHFYKFGHLAGVIVYATDFGNISDVSNYAVQIISNLSWLSFALMGIGWTPSLTYNVVSDLSAVHNPLRAGDGFPDSLQFFSDVHQFSLARELHLTMACISLVLCNVQLIKTLDFHPRMGLVSRTIGNAAAAMAFFFALFFGVVVIYAFLGSIQYGSSLDSFSTTMDAVQTLLIMLCGEFGDFKEQMDEVNTGITLLFFWSFFCICYFILMNAFLAIIVEAYEAAKSGFDDFSYSDAFWVIFKRALSRKRAAGNYHIDDHTLEVVLDYCMDHWDASETEAKEVPEIIADFEQGRVFPGIKDHCELIPFSKRAMVVRIEQGDVFEDGTVDEMGQRIFFSENHLKSAIMNDTINKIKDEALARLIAHNVLERFGLSADIDGDGEITNSEILALAANSRHAGNAITQMTINLAQQAQSLAKMDALENGLTSGVGLMTVGLGDFATRTARGAGEVGNFMKNAGPESAESSSNIKRKLSAGLGGLFTLGRKGSSSARSTAEPERRLSPAEVAAEEAVANLDLGESLRMEAETLPGQMA